MCQTVMKETFALLPETNENDFWITMDVTAQKTAFAQMIIAAQQGKLPDERKIEEAEVEDSSKLKKSMTLRAFEATKRRTMEAMEKQMRGNYGRGGD